MDVKESISTDDNMNEQSIDLTIISSFVEGNTSNLVFSENGREGLITHIIDVENNTSTTIVDYEDGESYKFTHDFYNGVFIDNNNEFYNTKGFDEVTSSYDPSSPENNYPHTNYGERVSYKYNIVAGVSLLASMIAALMGLGPMQSFMYTVASAIVSNFAMPVDIKYTYEYCVTTNKYQTRDTGGVAKYLFAHRNRKMYAREHPEAAYQFVQNMGHGEWLA